MKIERFHEKGICVLCLEGQFDAVAAPESESALLDLATNLNEPVVLDLTNLEYIGSLGLQAMLKFDRALREKGLALRLCGLAPFVMQVFEISQFARLFDIRATREEACANMPARVAASRAS